MSIQIKLHDDLFATGGHFFEQGVPKNKAKIVIGTGRNDLPTGITSPGNQTGLLISKSGAYMEDLALEQIMQNQQYRGAYGNQIIWFVQKGLIEVIQNGTTTLTDTALNAFTA